MKLMQRVLATAAIAGICAFAGCAATAQPAASVQPIFASDAAPQTSPPPSGKASNLPPGHPAIDSASVPQGNAVTPPPGCPASGSTGMMPSASTQPSQGIAMNPPPGCPASGSTGAMASASTQPSEVGTLSIHAVQCTPGGPAVGAAPVSIQFVVHGQLLDHLDANLNAAGDFNISGLPVRFGLEPIVRITHAGIVFTTAGETMDMNHPTQKLQVPIYETTEQAPQWSVSMRHVIIHPSPSGLDVTEMLSIQTTGDHAWIGKADAHGTRTTFCLDLPAGTKDLKVAGALDPASVVSFADGKMVSKQPLIPGEDRYALQYHIPAADNKAVLSVVAPANVADLLVFLPEDGTTIDAPGLQSMGSQQLNEKGPKTRCFIATSLKAGQTIALTVSGLKAAAAAATVQPSLMDEAPAMGAGKSVASKVIAAGGAVGILFVGTLVVLFKSPKSAEIRKGK